MIQKLVWENIRHRPLRTLLSALLIAIPVTLVLTLVGLSRGMIDDSRRRASAVGADILIRPKGSSVMTGLSEAPIPEKLLDYLRKQPHVQFATGVVVRNVQGFLSSMAGINIDEFTRMSNGGFHFVAGGPFRSNDDIIVDEYYARERKLSVGSRIELINRTWTVCGIVKSGVLNRLFVDLRNLQELSGSSQKLSQIYLKVDDPKNIPAVIDSLRKELVDYPIYSMEEFVSLLRVDSITELRIFIRVMIGIAVVIGFAVVCLSMYMAVLQRTREIGILKSLGASKLFVLAIIVREAVLMSIVGTVIGILLSFGARWALNTFVPSSFRTDVTPDWWPYAGLIALAGAVLGSLYPGWRAASQDPIEALAYE